MKLPSNVLKFTVPTSFSRIGISWSNKKKPIESKTNRWQNSKPQKYLYQYLGSNHKDNYLSVEPKQEIDYQEEIDLTHELSDDIFCRHCGNTLSFNYSTVRNGWMVGCTYCGMNGPVERDKEKALIGFTTIITNYE